jgi:hypothetical protein
VSGRQTNMHIDTIKVFANSLDVTIDEIVDWWNLFWGLQRSLATFVVFG